MPNIADWNIILMILMVFSGNSMAMLERSNGIFHDFSPVPIVHPSTEFVLRYFCIITVVRTVVEIGIGTDCVNVSRTTLTYPTNIG